MIKYDSKVMDMMDYLLVIRINYEKAFFQAIKISF